MVRYAFGRSSAPGAHVALLAPPGQPLTLAFNIANSAPQVLAPALAAPIVTYLGGYPALFGTVAAATVAGSVFVTKIRSVR